MGRNEYLQLIAADPRTGVVPQNIRQAELRYDRLVTERTARFRTDELSIEANGPFNVGGRTRAVAFDVRNERVILAGGVSGGIWKSVNGGDTWVRTSDPENRNSVTCIVQDIRPGKEDTWYHGTGEIVGGSARGGSAPFRGNGIYKSTDNGERWFPLASTQDADPSVFNSQFQYIWNLEINPQNESEDELLAATYGGILRSTDGGENWEVALGQKLFDLPESENLNESDASFYTSLERSADNVFFATLSTETSTDAVSNEAGIYYSNDGQNWNRITPFTSASRYRRIVIGSSPSNPDITYFMVDSSPILILEHRLSAVSAQSNGFDIEPRVVPAFDEELGIVDTQGSYNMMIRIHPADPNTVFLGATNLFRSTDGFKTEENISWIGGYNPVGGASVYEGHHPDQHDLLFLPSNPDVALSASDGGLRMSSDILADSVFWESKNDGFITSQFFTIAQSKVTGDATVLGGMQDNGTDLSPNGDDDWDGIIGGDGGYPATTRENLLWFASFQRGQTLRLTLNNEFDLTSFGRVDPGNLVAEAGGAYLFVNPFVLDPTNENRMFCAGGNHLYFHPNVSQIPGGSQDPVDLGWSRVNERPLSLNEGVVSAVSVTKNGKQVYYGTSAGRLFKLNNADQNLDFDLDILPVGTLPADAYVSCIAVNPEDSDHFIVVFSNYNIPSIFESRDGGATFQDISGNLEENPDGSGSGSSVRWAEIVPTTSGVNVFVGTSTGLYQTKTIAGASTMWVKQSPDLIGSAVVPMMDYRVSDGSLVIATHGNGTFSATVPNFRTLTGENPDSPPFKLVSAFPNPMQDQVQIAYELPIDGVVRVDILTSSGALVNTILWANQFAGANSVFWDGKNATGYPLSNGIYFYRIQYAGQFKSGRLMLRR